jgi:hypothetical protein
LTLKKPDLHQCRFSFLKLLRIDTFCKKVNQQKWSIFWQKWGEFDRNRLEIIPFFKKA